MPQQKSNKEKGFTLIELLVVISIISLLSSVIIANVNDARHRASDLKILLEFRQVKVALESYYSDHNSYPPYSNVYNAWNGPQIANPAEWDNFKTALKPYIPTDMEWLNKGYFMYDANSGDSYQTYGMALLVGFYGYGQNIFYGTTLPLAQNDGGALDSFYEVGPQVAYCKNKYAGQPSQADAWFNTEFPAGDTHYTHDDWVCNGGN